MLQKALLAARRGIVAPVALMGMAACFLGTTTPAQEVPRRPAPVATPVKSAPPKPETRRLGAPSAPKDRAGLAVYRVATKQRALKVMVSTEDRWLWLVKGRDTLVSVPVAVGMGKTFTYGGKSWRFATPRGTRKVLRKATNPIWTVPDWHYYERAAREKLELVHMKPGQRYVLSDGTHLEMRGDSVGRVNQFGNFWAVDPGLEIIWDGKIFVPPLTSAQRRVPDALGPYKLDTGDGYLIHGTHIYNAESVGRAVSHGCVRMSNEDLTRLYSLVPVGTPVYIF